MQTAYLVTPLTYSHETLFTHTYPHGEPISLNNLRLPLDRFMAILNLVKNTKFPMFLDLNKNNLGHIISGLLAKSSMDSYHLDPILNSNTKVPHIFYLAVASNIS